MIVRRYGNRVHSVVLNFDPAAMTEVGFRRDGEEEWDAEEFEALHELVREEEVIAEATHLVQDTAEREMLETLQQMVHDLHEALEEGQYLSIESQPGVDHPRTRYDRTTKGEREFTYTLDRPLRMGIWARKVN